MRCFLWLIVVAALFLLAFVLGGPVAFYGAVAGGTLAALVTLVAAARDAAERQTGVSHPLASGCRKIK